MSDSTSPPGGSPDDRRSALRSPALRAGRLVLPYGLGPEVLIVDISSTGALVRLRSPQSLPQDLVLVDRETRMAHRAVVVRSKELDVGLKFLKSLSLVGAVPAPLAAAKSWCFASG